MKNFFKTNKQDKARALCSALLHETKYLVEIYNKNISNISDLNKSSFEQGIQGYGIDIEVVKLQNQLNDKSFKNFMFTYASIRSLYSYIEDILIELDIEELNKKEYENIVNLNLPTYEEIMKIDKDVGFQYKEENDDPILDFLSDKDENGNLLISGGLNDNIDGEEE